MDANGINQDEQNIVNIVTHAKRIGNQKGFIFVINSEIPTFNKGMRSTVKLFFDSFGPQFLSHLVKKPTGPKPYWDLMYCN